MKLWIPFSGAKKIPRQDSFPLLLQTPGASNTPNRLEYKNYETFSSYKSRTVKDFSNANTAPPKTVARGETLSWHRVAIPHIHTSTNRQSIIIIIKHREGAQVLERRLSSSKQFVFGVSHTSTRAIESVCVTWQHQHDEFIFVAILVVLFVRTSTYTHSISSTVSLHSISPFNG